MNEKSAARWREIRARGWGYFVLVYGALLWGWGSAVTFIVVHRVQYGVWIRDVPGTFIFYSVGGLFWGLAMWFFMERMYRKTIETGE